MWEDLDVVSVCWSVGPPLLVKCWQSELCPVADVDGWAGEM